MHYSWSHSKEKESVSPFSLPRWGYRILLKVGLWTGMVNCIKGPNSHFLYPYSMPREVESLSLPLESASPVVWPPESTRNDSMSCGAQTHTSTLSLGVLTSHHVNTPGLAWWMMRDIWPSHPVIAVSWPPGIWDQKNCPDEICPSPNHRYMS